MTEFYRKQKTVLNKMVNSIDKENNKVRSEIKDVPVRVETTVAVQYDTLLHDRFNKGPYTVRVDKDSWETFTGSDLNSALEKLYSNSQENLYTLEEIRETINKVVVNLGVRVTEAQYNLTDDLSSIICQRLQDHEK